MDRSGAYCSRAHLPALSRSFSSFTFISRRPQEDERTTTAHHRQQVGRRHEIRGVNFNAVTEGRKHISLQADRLCIEKKKIGFFRCGLINKATLENAIIHIYGSREAENGAHRSGTGDRTLTFRDAFSTDGLPSFHTKKIASIVMKPVSVELHDEKTSVTSISADSAEIDFDRRCILFQGFVRMASGNRALVTSRLNLFTDPAENTMRAPISLSPRRNDVSKESDSSRIYS